MDKKGTWIKLGEYEGNLIEMFVEDRPSVWEKDSWLRITKATERGFEEEIKVLG